jgi:hypothetical protein
MHPVAGIAGYELCRSQHSCWVAGVDGMDVAEHLKVFSVAGVPGRGRTETFGDRHQWDTDVLKLAPDKCGQGEP